MLPPSPDERRARVTDEVTKAGSWRKPYGSERRELLPLDAAAAASAGTPGWGEGEPGSAEVEVAHMVSGERQARHRRRGDDDVAAGAAIEDIDAAAADQDVVAGIAVQLVVAGAADQDVVAVAAIDGEL